MFGKPLPWRNNFAFAVISKMAFAISSLEAVSAIGTILRGKRVRGWNSLNRLARSHRNYYANWITSGEKNWYDSFLAESHLHEDAFIPVCLVFEADHHPVAAVDSIASLKAAFGSNVPILVDSDQEGWGEGVAPVGRASLRQLIDDGKIGGEDYLLPVRAGDRMSPLAGRVLSHARQRAGDAPILFWDTDILVDGVRSQPWLKPAWDRWLYLSGDTLSGASLIKGSAVASARHDLLDVDVSAASITEILVMLAGCNAGGIPMHVPGVLGHRAREQRYVSAARWKEIVADCWSEPVEAMRSERDAFFVHHCPPAPSRWPSVSIIIPTRDRVDLLRTCIGGLEKLDYAGQVEILIVDNGSSDPEALSFVAFLDASGRAKVLRDGGAFNFSRLNNLAARQAGGEILCLLNNDIETIDGDWLSVLVRFAQVPGVGAAGPMLTYPDGSIQHAGVVIGIGGAAGHVCRYSVPGQGSDLCWHGTTRTVSAVTAACLVVRKDAWCTVAGLDEDDFAVAFNDVDFCMKLQAAGLRNIYVPAVRLVHHESISRGSDMAPANRERFAGELARFQSRWGIQNFADPYFSPLYDSSSEQCLLKF